MSVIYCEHAWVINFKTMYRTNRHLNGVNSQLFADCGDERVHLHEWMYWQSKNMYALAWQIGFIHQYWSLMGGGDKICFFFHSYRSLCNEGSLSSNFEICVRLYISSSNKKVMLMWSTSSRRSFKPGWISMALIPTLQRWSWMVEGCCVPWWSQSPLCLIQITNFVFFSDDDTIYVIHSTYFSTCISFYDATKQHCH